MSSEGFIIQKKHFVNFLSCTKAHFFVFYKKFV